MAAVVVVGGGLGGSAQAFGRDGTRNLRESEDTGPLVSGVLTSGEGVSTATGGELFSMEKIRAYAGPRLDLDHIPERFATSEETKCDRWAVLTSIFEPTEAVRQLAASSNDWCVVVVGDKKGAGCCIGTMLQGILRTGIRIQLGMLYKLSPKVAIVELVTKTNRAFTEVSGVIWRCAGHVVTHLHRTALS